ncbi:MAG: DUF4499 domain-containing protein, partial [Microthrixaceae bacterium]
SMSTARRPSLAWRVFVVVGVGTSVALTVSDPAWEKWHSVLGDKLPRQKIKSLVVGTAAIHSAEAASSYISAKRGNLDQPGRWALSTFLWGFPVMSRLRKARRAESISV